MKRSFLFLLIFLVVGRVSSQENQLKVGDDAPALHIEKWMKGTPVSKFEKGKVYVEISV